MGLEKIVAWFKAIISRKDLQILLVLFVIPICVYLLSGFIGASIHFDWNISSPIINPIADGINFMKDANRTWLDSLPFLNHSFFDWFKQNNLLTLFLLYVIVFAFLTLIVVNRKKINKFMLLTKEKVKKSKWYQKIK